MVRLQASAQRASDMIERHLQLQRLDQPDAEVLLDTARLAVCLEQVRAAVVEAWPGCEFRFRVQPGAPEVATMDTELVVRAVTNLLSNAARASPPGRPVELDLMGDRRGGVRFEVRDGGPGLGEMSLQHLLEMHWHRTRPDPHRAGDLDGSFGIGLPMAARIAALHQGEVAYRRESDSTVMSLWLPEAEDGPRAPDTAGGPRQIIAV
jgi:two-component system sensor histidine kinase CreC